MPYAQLFLSLGIRAAVEAVATRCGFPAAAPVAKSDGSEIRKCGIAVKVTRHPRARRYLLRLQADGTARLVIPRRGSRAEALRFLDRNEGWLLERHRKWQANDAARRPWVEGTSFLFRGEMVVLAVAGTGERVEISFAGEKLEIARSGDYRGAVHAHLRRLAERELPVRTRELAERHGIAITRVTVRAQKTRWGSCSARGTISLNWRLIQAPASVQDYLIIHELMHRRQMNHSVRFWKLVEAECPGYREAERWLKATRLGEMG